jgi:uncharacterized protein (DUF488 family)
MRLWTVGHSTRSLDEFLATLAPYGIELVADVRRFPGSRAHPQFAQAALEAGLHAAGIEYLALPALGGRRRPGSDAGISGWRNEAFRGYAEHLASEEFAGGLFELTMAAGGMRTAVMCAEVLWWRCHRRMIADVLVAQGEEVVHIMDATANQPHRLAPPARLVRGVLTYDRAGPGKSSAA